MNETIQKNAEHNLTPIAGGYSKKTVSNAAVSLSDLEVEINPSCKYGRLAIESEGVRFTLDNSDPTLSHGEPLDPGSIHMLSLSELKLIKFHRSGGSDATIHIHQLQG